MNKERMQVKVTSILVFTFTYQEKALLHVSLHTGKHQYRFASSFWKNRFDAKRSGGEITVKGLRSFSQITTTVIVN